jgi:predicted DNA-binding transcriptional regulator AlpA
MPDGSSNLHQLDTSPVLVVSDPFLRVREVMVSTGLGRSSKYRRVAAGTFPAPKQIGGGQVRWRTSEVELWKAERHPAGAKVIPPCLDPKLKHPR